MNGEPVVAGHEMSGQSDGIVFTRNGSVGRITLDRPKSLNALTLDIVHALHACLDEWQRAAGTVLVFDSSSDKAFCAGGDVRRIRQNALAGRHADNVEFFTAEYELNLRLAELDTPLVSVIDGICFGGGLGLSVHGAFRVLTERATLAMPETGIGFLPDVGASYFLSRLPGAVGTYLGLTGYRLDAADALYVGLGTHRVADAGMVISALERRTGSVDHALRALSPGTAPAPPGRLASHRDDIDWCFGANTVTEIRTRLGALSTQWAEDSLAALDAASPQSLEVTMSTLAMGKQMGLRNCLSMELDIATRIVRTRDFCEGVRARLVDKDGRPVWVSLPNDDFADVKQGLWAGPPVDRPRVR